jgi:capsular polysaccharide biosynthesis protein
VRASVTVRPTATQQSGWLAFDIVARDSDKRRTARVANTLAELYIQQTRDARIVEARETTRALELQVDEARAEFEAIDRRVQTFLAGHSFETESHLDANLRLLETANRDLEHNLSQQTETGDRMKQLQADLDELKGGKLSANERLVQLRGELDQLLISYSEAHPAVTRKRREIDELVATMSTAGPADRDDDRSVLADPKARLMAQQIDDARRELAALETAASRQRTLIAEYQRRIQAVAQVQPQLTQLQTQHKTALDRLNSQQDKLDRAKESQLLEESRQAWQLELAERAEIPRIPVFPIPQRFYALGVLAGLLVFVGPVIALRVLNPPVSSEAGLRVVTDVPVLVSIPRIEAVGFRGSALRSFAKNAALAAVSAAVLVAVVYFV